MRPLQWNARLAGGALCAAGLVLVATPPLLAGALGLELVALAFWVWGRASDDAPEQLRRWAWLRRPAQAMWLATATQAVRPWAASRPFGAGGSGAAELLLWIEALAVVWAGLELLAALPITRPYSDLTGPLLDMRPWLPLLLPAAGFAILWRHAAHWTTVPEVRGAAALLLLGTAILATLRAFGRRQWGPGLRWLMVSDCALAGILVSSGAVHAPVSLMLWLGVSGGRATMLAGELRGATPRRGAALSRLWRLASWTGSAALAWPLLVHAGWGRSEVPGWLRFTLVSFPVTLTAWITVRRIVQAPERRQITRREAAFSLSHLSAALVMGIGPLALLLAWWSGFEASWPAPLLALAPSLLGGGIALLGGRGGEQARVVGRIESLGATPRALARRAFRMVTALERRVVGMTGRAAVATLAPLNDLHTGDAQEYLLFLVGVSVLALVLPFLR
jgi:hypothetical protein